MSFSLLYISLIFLYFFKVMTLTVNVYEIRDLEDTTSYFETESQTWQLFNSLQSYKSTSCDGTTTYLLGGYQVISPGGIFTRTYYSLPSHNTVSFSAIFWILDLDKTANLFEIFIDNQYLGVWDSTLYDAHGASYQTNYCGYSVSDFPNFNIRGKVPHSNSQITIKIISSGLTGDTFSFGFRSLSLLFSTSVSTVTTSSCKFVNPPALQATCGCQDGYFNPAGSSSCLPCDSSCASCSGGTANDCNSCKPGYSWDGTKCFQCHASCSQCSGTAASQCVRCTDSAYFLQVDGTCSSTCSSPYVAKTNGNYKICDYPCGVNGFVNDNSTCSTSCPYPYNQATVSGIKYCHLPCPLNQILFKDQTCKSNCPSTFIPGTDGYIQYCTTPCASTEFYNPNSTCTSSCPSPFIESASGGTKYCSSPCSGSNFLYQNGSCLASCLYPYLQTSDGFLNYCNLPCSSGQFLNENGNCTTSCLAPYVQFLSNGVLFCNRPCGANFLYQNNNTCAATCVAPYTQVDDGYIKYCVSPCSSGAPFLNDNNNCTASCSSPYVQSTSNGVQYCSRPCGSDFLYEKNNTCGATCVAPYTQTTDGYVKYCVSPCSSGWFLNENNNCTSSCPSPYVQSESNGVKYCSKPCGNIFLYQNNTCGAACIAPYTQTTDGYVKYCISPCLSVTPFLNDNNNCTATCPSPYIQSESNGVKYCGKPCGNIFLYQNNTCGATCIAPYTQTTDGYVKYCISPCLSATPFLNENANCTVSCPSPYVQSASNGIRYCNRPCGTDFLYQNNTCETTCLSPYIQVTDGFIKYCHSACDSSKFLYENGSCLSSCPSPFKQRSSGGLQYCDKPCTDSLFLYPNGSCLSQCDYNDMTDSNQIRYCQYPCSASQYYYEDATCKKICPIPYEIQIVDDDLNLCNSPCSNTSLYYSENQKKCITSCSSPYTSNSDGFLKICQDIPAEDDDGTTLSDVASSVSSISDVVSKAGSLFRSGKNSIFMVSLAKMIRYVIYMNITLPEPVKESFESSNSSFFSISMMFSFDMPSSWSNAFPVYPLPVVFTNNKLSSCYLVNQWNSLTSYVTILMIGVVSGLVEKITKRKNWKAVAMVFTRLRIMTKWAFVLFLLFNSYDDVTLYLILQLYGLQFHSHLDYISFAVCLVVTIVTFAIFGKAVFIVYKAQKMKNQITDIKSAKTPEVVFYNRWHKFQVLYAGFKPKSFFMQVYLMTSTARIIACYLIVGFLYKYPILQGSLLVIISVCILGFLLYKRPVKDVVNYIVMITYETLILLVNICVLIIASLDSYDDYTDPSKAKSLDIISNILIILNASIDICSNAFMYIYILTNSWSFYKLNKKTPGLESKLVWLTLFVVPYQNPGMDFDDFCWEPSSYEKRPSVMRRSYPIEGRQYMENGPRNSFTASSMQVLNRRFSNSSQNTNDPTSVNDGSHLANYEPNRRSPTFLRAPRKSSNFGSQNFLELDSDYHENNGFCSPTNSEVPTMDTPKSFAHAFLLSKKIDGSPASRARNLRKPGRPGVLRKNQIPIVTNKPQLENFTIIEEPSPMIRGPSEARRKRKTETTNREQEEDMVKNNRFMDYSQPIYARSNNMNDGSERKKTLRILNSHVIKIEDLEDSDQPLQRDQSLKRMYEKIQRMQDKMKDGGNDAYPKKKSSGEKNESEFAMINTKTGSITQRETSYKEDEGLWQRNPRGDGFLRTNTKPRSFIKEVFFPE